MDGLQNNADYMSLDHLAIQRAPEYRDGRLPVFLQLIVDEYQMLIHRAHQYQ